MAWLRSFLLVACVVAIGNVQAWADTPLEATTDDGRRVILHPDGRWEFGPSDGAPASRQAAPPTSAASGTANAATRSDDRYCQGGLFGVGRRICPGDPEYNRGSLNPKLR